MTHHSHYDNKLAIILDTVSNNIQNLAQALGFVVVKHFISFLQIQHLRHCHR